MKLSALAAVLVLAATPALADVPSDQAEVDALMAAVNGDATAREGWLASHVAETPRMPKAEFPDVLDGISGGSLKATSWTRRGDNLRVLVESADHHAGRIDLRFKGDEPGRLNALIVAATPGAYPDEKVTGPVDRATLKAAIEHRVRYAADRDEFSGVVLVVKDQEVIYAGTFGEADKAAHLHNTLATRFNLGSMDKQFTAVAIGQLIERGKLSLDTRLIDVLPDYPNKDAARKITIRHLLSHSAGLGMMFERPGWDWKRPITRHAEFFPLFADAPLEFEPGARSSYSNEGFAVLGAVVEKVSGQSWYDYVARHIFRPADMTRTGYPVGEPGWPDRAVGYRFTDADPLGLKGREPNWANLGRGYSFGGGFSTAGDMIRFLQALHAGKLVKPQTAALLTAQAPGGLADYGLGFKSVTSAGGRTIRGHDGGGPRSGVNSDAEMVWETGYAYAVLGNYDSPFTQTVGRDIGAMLAAQE